MGKAKEFPADTHVLNYCSFGTELVTFHAPRNAINLRYFKVKFTRVINTPVDVFVDYHIVLRRHARKGRNVP